MTDLSILICSIYGREESLKRLLSIILPEKHDKYSSIVGSVTTTTYKCGRFDVIVMQDGKRLTVGDKRNKLISLADSTYVSFIDDDDIVMNEYTTEILNAMSNDPDCIVFDAIRFVDGKKDKQVKYGIEYGRDYNDDQFYYRIPNHLMAVKKQIASYVKYRAINFGEDSLWAKNAFRLIKTQARIDKVLYHYLFSVKNTATQRR